MNLPNRSTLLLFAISSAAFLGGWWAAQRDTSQAVAPASRSRFARTSGLTSAEAKDQLRAIDRTDDPVARRRDMLDFITSASSADLRKILLAAEDRSARLAAAQQWAETDPQALFDFLTSTQPSDLENFDEVRGTLFRTWARTNADAAMAAAKSCRKRSGMSAGEGEVFYGLVEVDPDRAFTLLAKGGIDTSGGTMKKAIWASDPGRFAQAAAKALKESPNLQWILNGKAVMGSMTDWAKADLSGALKWVQGQDPAQRRKYLPLVVGEMAAKDRAQATALFESLPPSVDRERVGPAIVQEWAKTDPQAALDWLEKNLTGGKAEAYAALIQGCADDKDFGPAAALVNGLPDSQGRDRAIGALADRWIAKDAKHAIDWILSLPSGYAKNRAVEAAGSTWADKDPQRYLEYFAQASDEDFPRNNSYYVSQALLSQPMEKAVDWLKQLPADRAQSVAQTYFNNQMNTVDQAVKTLGQLEGSDLRAPLLSGVARRYVGVGGTDEPSMDKLISHMTPAERQSTIDNLSGTSWSSDSNNQRRDSLIARLRGPSASQK